MKKNRITSRFLAMGMMVLLWVTIMPEINVSAALLLTNGGFENGTSGWYRDSGAWESEYLFSEDAHGGEKALRIKGNTSLYVRSAATKMKAGSDLTFNGFYKVNSLLSNASYPAVKIEFFDANKSMISEEANFVGEYKNPKTGAWIEVSETVQSPENAAYFRIFVRLINGGDILWDDITVRDTFGEMSVPYAEPLPGETNKITGNAGFEDGLRSWYGGGGGVRSVVTDSQRGKVLKIVSEDDSKPYVSRSFAVKEGEKYQLSAWLKTDSVEGEGPAFKVEFYNRIAGQASVSGAQDIFAPHFEPTYGEWKRVWIHFTVGENTNLANIYVRLYGKGIVYYDDIECVKIAEPAYAFRLDTHVFYYTEWDEGDAYFRVNHPSDGTVDFTLYDGETVLNHKVLSAEEETKYRFPVHLLKEKGKGYKIRAVHNNAKGEELGRAEDIIYRYDRPSHLTEDGLFRQHDGTIIKPVLGYHNYQSDFAKIKEMGVNVVQSDHSASDRATMLNIEYLLQYMDDAWENHGMMTAVVMYPGGTFLTHASRKEQAIRCVNAVKNHPGLFGYIIYDEPFVGYEDEGAEEIYEELKECYRTIRTYDSDHPTYFCENYGYRYDWSSDCTDILGIDPYPYTKNIRRFVYDAAVSAARASEHRKPVYNVLQAWPWNNYEPNSTELRNMAYQAMFGGNEGLALYDLSDFYGETVNGNKVYTNLWDRELSKGAKDFFENEYEDAYKAFITGEYPIFCEYYGYEATADNWYRVYVKDGDLYAVVLNLNMTPTTVEIPLVSSDGTISIGNFTATEADNSGLLPTVTGNGTLRVKLTLPCQAARYKITPTTPVNFDSLTATRFRDLAGFAWAKEAVSALDAKGILHTKALWRYAPEEKITRADFAYFLMNTLKLESKDTENFADVNPDVYYADALLTGKTLGILKSVEENNFAPYADIRREEAMSICARAINFAEGAADINTLQSFTNGEYIPDYAVASVAAALRNAVINEVESSTLGADGMLTRAEAAMMMHRILLLRESAWKNEGLSLTAEEASILTDGLLSEGGTYEDRVWYKMWECEGETYLLVQNGGTEACSLSIAFSGAAAELVLGDTRHFTETGITNGELQLTVQKDEVFFARIKESKEPGLYRGNFLVKKDFSGTYTVHDADYVAAYKENELVYFSAEETVVIPEGCEVKTFSWDGMMPRK